MLERAMIKIWDQRKDKNPEIEEGAKRTVGLKNYSLPDQFKKELSQGERVKIFMVQFNPKELTITSTGGEVAKLSRLTEGQGVGLEPVPPMIKLSVTVIFNNTYNQDAFMADKFVAGPTNVVKGIANAIVNGNKKFSVRTQVQGFLAMVRNEYSKKVSFIWGKLCYEGILNDVDATYTMFNPDGEPVNARVTLGILCLNHSLEPFTGKKWKEKYTEVFINNGISGSAGQIKQKAANLLNISF